MRFYKQHIGIVRLLAFVALLFTAALVDIHNIEKDEASSSEQRQESVVYVDVADDVVVPIGVQMPRESGRILPIELIYNPNTLLEIAIGNVENLYMKQWFLQQKQIYGGYCAKISSYAMIRMAMSLRNKDIQ